MQLIHEQGLNCYLCCVISIAAALGINHPDAYAALWSETDFTFEPEHRVYSSKRILSSLQALGARVEPFRCHSPEEAEASLSLVPDGTLFIVGMDAFHTPWNPVYAYFHGTHYFFARKARQACPCFDPIYNIDGEPMDTGLLLAHAFAIEHVRSVPATSLPPGLLQEVQSILRDHPGTRETLLRQIEACAGERRKLSMLILQMDAMINNRHLYGHFLHQPARALDPGGRFFDKQFLSRWEAVKNGLYKALVMRDNASVIQQVSALFGDLMHEEAAMAEEMIALAAQLPALK